MYRLSFKELRDDNNNLWYRCGRNECAVVFVHGILADSRSCWTHRTEDGEAKVFWPDLIHDDDRLPPLDIFLGGYFTAIDAGEYGIDDCASELFGGLNRPDTHQNPTVLSYSKIVFVCHSTGGIVARYMLEHYRKRFKGKTIGLILIASPSDGSKWANLFELLATIYKNKLGRQLMWRNWSLEALDRNFKELVHDPEKEFELKGVEAYENRFIVHRTFFPPIVRVVQPDSAGKYFGVPRHLRNTDHFSAVKPNSIEHPSHELVLDFIRLFSIEAESQNVNREREESKTIQIRFETERKPNAIDLQRTIHQIRAGQHLGRIFQVPLALDERISRLFEGLKGIYADYENKLGEDADARDFAMLSNALNSVTASLEGLPALVGLAAMRLLQARYQLGDEKIALAISNLIELKLAHIIEVLAAYQLATDPLVLFPEYFPERGGIAAIVARTCDVPMASIVSFRIVFVGTTTERVVFAPKNYLSILREFRFRDKGRGYFLLFRS